MLHWLPVGSRMQYNVLVLVHACVNNVALSYLSILLTRCVPSNEIRMSGQLIFYQPIPNMMRYYGERSQLYGGPKMMEPFGSKVA